MRPSWLRASGSPGQSATKRWALASASARRTDASAPRQVRPGLGVIRDDHGRLPQGGLRSGRTIEPLQHAGQIAPGRRQGRIETQGFADERLGLGRTVAARPHHAEQMPRGGDERRQLDRRLGGAVGLDERAAAEQG